MTEVSWCRDPGMLPLIAFPVNCAPIVD